MLKIQKILELPLPDCVPATGIDIRVSLLVDPDSDEREIIDVSITEIGPSGPNIATSNINIKK